MTKVWDESPYEGIRLLIHLAMADTAHDDGQFFASQKILSEKARCSIEYVRLTIRDMESRGLIKIVKRGSSKGFATVYQMLWTVQPPKSVGESPDIALPKSDGQPPKSDGSLPNSTGEHPSYTSVLSIHNEIVPISVGEKVAKLWWESQTVKPIGKNAWFALLAVCKASEERGYTEEQILQALSGFGTVPSVTQMDLALRGRLNKNTTKATQVATDALMVARQLAEQGE